MEPRRAPEGRLIPGARSFTYPAAGAQFWLSLLPPFCRELCECSDGESEAHTKLLGHSRYETTANIYTHSPSDQDPEAAVAVERAIFGESVRNVRENTNNKGSKASIN